MLPHVHAGALFRCFLSGFLELTYVAGQQRSGDLDSKNPVLGGVSFQQLHLVSLYSTDGVKWMAEIQ